ncbi:type IX secretion system sortase PorU [Flavobacterium akiainvivens]|nr:type IX secretion system sortase PorU [Flavobacterium akiainvivens]
MMKHRLLILAFLYSFIAAAQQNGRISLNWQDNTRLPYAESSITIPSFQGEYMSFEPVFGVLDFVATLPETQRPDEASLVITNPVYETVSREQLGQINLSKIPASQNATLSASHSRDKWFAVITLSPIIKEGSGFKRLTSFTYSYNYSVSANQRTLDVNSTNEVVNSVLASGQWHRFYVEKSGVYRLSRSFLQSIGVDTNTDPRKIKIYGNGGRMAPLTNSTAYPLDPEENAVRFVGEDDGSFDSNDYILFYAEGVDNWNTESETNNNLYSNRAYYYVTSVGANNGKRIQPNLQPAGAATQQTAIFDEYQFHERDLVSVARLGRKWHGEAFNIENEQEFDFTIPDITSDPVNVTISAAAYSNINTSMAVTANGASLTNLNFAAVTDASHNLAANGSGGTGSFVAAGGDITIKMTYNNSGNPSANAWLDYIILRAKRNLRGNGRQFRFRLNSAGTTTGILQYNVSNASSIAEVWDITDIYNATSLPNDGNQASFSFKANLGEVRQYITVVSGDYYTPLRDGNSRVANVNLKGTILKNSQGQFQDVDYIIVTPAFLSSAAENLANIHRNVEGMSVKVVTLEDIYAEFSTGQQDIAAIRNFIKYVYNNASSDEGRLKYVCMFGDASFDYKNRIPGNTNIVPSFHAYGGGTPDYSEVSTFVSDDFFGMMDANEGLMRQSAEKADVAMGRMLVTDMAQANDMVNKVSEYLSEDAYGKWRNEYIAMVDDLDGDGSTGFVGFMESMITTANVQRPAINFKKVYIDAWVQEASSGGQRYPEAKEEFLRAINYGALVVNYLGHGNIRAMASERMFEAADAQNLTNRYRYPLFITATCELTKFDNPYEDTTGEEIYWNPRGGAIAMVTTTRALYITDANRFNSVFSKYLYAYGQSASQYPTMAEALRLSRAEASAYSYRPISFVGDPALKLAIPKPNIVLTEINDVPLAESTEVLEALSFVRLGGRVTDENNIVLANYNGELEVTVYDKPINRTTLNNDNIPASEGQVIWPFTTLGEAIFRGNATVTNGQFEFGFIVPRDIRIPVGEGRVSFYAKKNNTLEDQTGYNSVIKIGGINTNAPQDNTPPTVRLYMNDESFVSGGITNSSPILLAFLFDEHGINTASGIGHDIVGILDGDENNPYIMNDYYETAQNDYTHGTVRFPFVNLEKGLHTLQFKAWDVYNNLVTAEIQFVVAGDEGVTLERVLNYPNPFVSYTEFWFSHNRPFEPLDVQVQVFTVTGKIVKTINQQITTDGFLSRDLKWDGRDDFGDRIGKGVYVYKLTVRSTITGKTAEKYEKLVLL